MFEAHNRLQVQNDEQRHMLEDRFSKAAEHMTKIPGFLKFTMLRAQDGSHYLVKTLWESEQHFQDWVKSPHFQAAHGGHGPSEQAKVASYDVIY